MTNATCSIEGCDKPRYQYRAMCAPHFMRAYRYGDPHHKPAPRYKDLTGKTFGQLTVLARVDSMWLCSCTCGATSTLRAGDLNRGAATCGNRSAHQRIAAPEYGAAHCRILRDFGHAANHPCVDCGGQAAHWSYNHDDPNEMVSNAEGTKGLPYSPSPAHYSARCVPCHKRFDLAHIHHTELTGASR